MDAKTDVMMRERRWLLNEKYDGVETSAFFADAARLARGELLAYLIGHVPFLDATIFLDSRPLIPRSETEHWTGQAIREIQKRETLVTVLDLCAGSGCIGVAVLKAIPMTYIDFAEIDTSHRAIIAKNLTANNVDHNRTSIYGGNLFDEIPKTKRYDFILTNPPYLDPEKVDRVEKSVINHEPARALFGGPDGMEFIVRILKEAPRYLAKPGVLYIEHEPEQTKAIYALADLLSYASCKTHPDQWRINRYTRLVQAY